MLKRITCSVRVSLAGLLCILTGHILLAQTTISGKITTTTGAPMPGVVIDIAGTFNGFVITDSAGNYTATLPTGGAYTLMPHSNRNPLNGVTSFDIVLIWKHFNNESLLTSPYRIIAADINNDGLITTIDSIEARRLILGIDTEFANNSSWRFVRSDYVFPDSMNPFQPPYPETYTNINLTDNVTDIDFYGIKIGDVNNTAIAAALTDSTHLSWIDGTVAVDQNLNCQLDSSESGLSGWLVKAINQHGSFYGKTDDNGQYSISVPPGTHAVIVYRPNDYWSLCEDTMNNVTTLLLGHTQADFPAQVEVECPYMTVDLATSFLRRCFNNSYSVQYCNQGTVLAEDAYVEVTFDTLLEVISSSLPWTSVNGNTYTFPLGDIPANTCGLFQVTVYVDCDADPGQTHCSSAHIYPDSLCYPTNAQWSGADLEVSGYCDDGEVVFQIKNNGSPMTDPVEYVVIEDIMIQMTGSPIQLGSGQAQIVATIPGNGATWRLEVEQPEFHPWSTLAAAWVEGCGTNTGGSFSTGFITQFPYGDDSPWEDIDCQGNIASFDPNDKTGFPLGVEAEHYVPRDQEMTYKIRFQNTGTDTAFNIMILDTLSAFLNPATLRTGSSSHPYTYNLLGEGVIQFLFQNILLPDSNVNEPLSHGFVQFNIRPRTGLPNNTVIENEAAIYFDFNDPVITNRTRHTFGEKYLNQSNVVFQPGLELSVFPNPATTVTSFYLKSPRPLYGRLLLSDSQGRFVREQSFQSNLFDIRTAGLPPGLYFYRLESEGKALAAGKLTVVEGL